MNCFEISSYESWSDMSFLTDKLGRVERIQRLVNMPAKDDRHRDLKPLSANDLLLL